MESDFPFELTPDLARWFRAIQTVRAARGLGEMDRLTVAGAAAGVMFLERAKQKDPPADAAALARFRARIEPLLQHVGVTLAEVEAVLEA